MNCDQYSDGKVAEIYDLYHLNKEEPEKREWLTNLLKKRNCQTILDVSCGTGTDSVMLLEEGFEMVSVDLSDQMLKHALKCRWNRRDEKRFNNWVIEEANWLTLIDDLEDKEVLIPDEGFDALMCIGNSFSHLLDAKGDQNEQLLSLKNFHDLLKPGGILIIDHRNYDAILETGKAPPNKCTLVKQMTTTIQYVDGKPTKTTFDYVFDRTSMIPTKKLKLMESMCEEKQEQFRTIKFSLSFFPHKLDDFINLLKESFNNNCQHEVYGDYRELSEDYVPHYYTHIIEKLG